MVEKREDERDKQAWGVLAWLLILFAIGFVVFVVVDFVQHGFASDCSSSCGGGGGGGGE
ncbi:hypothetical protein [Kitasatospora sp. LaBMicrA B282]|uniref:hypothetical protein n=1 Tax=Kitasatospora sp. LaBMicrA B282 TaxID=3420949 RepID=UPI003D0E51A4